MPFAQPLCPSCETGPVAIGNRKSAIGNYDGLVSDRLRAVASRHNPLLKDLRRAFRQSEPTPDGFVAIESVHLIEEAIRSGLRLRAVFFSQSGRARANRLLPQLSRHVETVAISDDVFSGAVPSETPQGVAALAAFPKHALDDVLSVTNPLVVVAAGVQDPGNLGAVVRSAEAFGAAALLAGEGTVSQFNAKAIRASAGSMFRLPLFRFADDELVATARRFGLRLLATSSHKGDPLSAADLRGPVALVIGNEGAGVPRSLARAVDGYLAIPHSPRVESLNAAVAAGILLYEASRQRKA